MTGTRLLALAALAFTLGAQTPSRNHERPLRVPDMPDSRILRKVNPIYPVAARQHRIQGRVWFSVTIGKDGLVEDLRLLSGHPLLVNAARAALTQWEFRPATVGGTPVRVITRIPVDFNLTRYLHPAPVA
jgi:protein TonB